MLHNEFEYRSEVARLADQHVQLAEMREHLRHSGLAEVQIDQATLQLRMSCQRLEAEVVTYERQNAPTWVPALH